MSGFISFKKLPYKVLVVEDEVLTRASLEQMLGSFFEEVHYAEDGHIGLEMFYRENPDIIFTDIVMPTMNGTEMLRQIKSSGDKDPLIIVFSAFDSTMDDEALSQIGIFRKMEKPFKANDINQLISDIRAHKSDSF